MLNQLNSAQKEAVIHIDGPMLILAGAGSGKTKTVVTRLAYLISKVGIPPEHTLTLTFSNKAAKEMKDRALKLIKRELNENADVVKEPLLCTFHKFGLIFLKRYIHRLNRENNFSIIDSEDKKRIIRQILKEKNINLNLQFVVSEISKYKNSLLSPADALFRAEISDYEKTAIVYQEYQNIIKENNRVDFDDLLALTYQILIEDDNLRKTISEYYRYIMVDEYQDTNELQYRLLKLLSSQHQNLVVVGDDDQSIYSWRGANISNILEFDKIYPDAKVVKLEMNYRSSKQILDTANSLIEHNRRRVGKRLISAKGDGANVELLHSLNESLEAKNIASKVKSLIFNGVNASDIAILYRINALSRSIEDGFKKEDIKFKLVGGIRFYERAEVKDIISYLRVIINPDDDFSLVRIINKPKRGIGKTSIDKIKALSLSQNISMFRLIKEIEVETLAKSVGKKNAQTLKNFIKMIEEFQEQVSNSLTLFLESFESRVDLRRFYSSYIDSLDKEKNIDEFLGYFREIIESNPSISLEEFLNDISLESEQEQSSFGAVNVMSIHASKGLEFEHVFVIGLEEGFFPLIGNESNLEEERRLGYVAITRAKNHLTLCYCDSRFYKGKRKILTKSRFLGESGLIKNSSLKINKSSEYKRGDLVKHPIFGIGRVQAVTKSGKEYKLRINFGSSKKDILSSFVKPI